MMLREKILVKILAVCVSEETIDIVEGVAEETRGVATVGASLAGDIADNVDGATVDLVLLLPVKLIM